MIERFQKGPRMAQVVAGATTIHIAGQVADDRKTGIEDQTRQVLAKIDAYWRRLAGRNPTCLRSIFSCRTSPISTSATPHQTCACDAPQRQVSETATAPIATIAFVVAGIG
jgi:enamine deaminase RidA (YjgF/YER057c/UK114 family)